MQPEDQNHIFQQEKPNVHGTLAGIRRDIGKSVPPRQENDDHNDLHLAEWLGQAHMLFIAVPCMLDFRIYSAEDENLD
jgi:hypothetical protein